MYVTSNHQVRMALGSAVMIVAAGVFVGLLGALIRYAGWTWLIAGYDPNRLTDEEGLADFMGFYVLVIAGLTVAIGALEAVDPSGPAGWYWLPYVVAVFVLTARMIRGGRRFETEADTAGNPS